MLSFFQWDALPLIGIGFEIEWLGHERIFHWLGYDHSMPWVIILYICTLTFCSFWTPQNSKLLLPSAVTSSINSAAPLPLEIINAHTRSVTLFLCSSFYLLCSLSYLILTRATAAFEIPQWGSIKYYLNTASTMFDRWHMLWFKSCSFLLVPIIWFFSQQFLIWPCFSWVILVVGVTPLYLHSQRSLLILLGQW